jgi:hypothetical protein
MDQPIALGTISWSTRGSTRKKGRNRNKKHSSQPRADCPASQCGPSGLLPRTVRANTVDRPAYSVDRPLNHTEPTEATHEPRTVRGEHADCPPGTRGPSETPSNRKPKTRRIETKGEQEHEEHETNPSRADRLPGPRGPSARCGQSRKRPTPKVNSPKSSSDFPNS